MYMKHYELDVDCAPLLPYWPVLTKQVPTHTTPL